VIMIAVDCVSFDATGSRDAIQSVAEFVRTPRGVERNGTHTLEVRVKRPGVDVRARRGVRLAVRPAPRNHPLPESFG